MVSVTLWDPSFQGHKEVGLDTGSQPDRTVIDQLSHLLSWSWTRSPAGTWYIKFPNHDAVLSYRQGQNRSGLRKDMPFISASCESLFGVSAPP